MKVGTDAVMLGAWVNVNKATKILDIGTGSGILALMVAQRTDEAAQIDAVEIEKQDATQAAENVLQSQWPSKISVHNSSIQDFTPDLKYDLIISNPPFFNNSQEPPDKRRHHTRHTVTLDFDTLIANVLRLLTPEGKFNIILPYTEGLQFIEMAIAKNLFCTRKYSFRSRAEKPIERWLLEFSIQQLSLDTGAIIHYENGSDWSDIYKRLTHNFYHKL